MLRITDTDRVRLLTLDRPEKKNAFDTGLYRATGEALDAAGADPEVAVVVLTGEGDAFSAGQDLGEMAALASDTDRAEGAGHGFPTFMDALTAFPKPLVAAVNGVGVGIGFTVFGHCDLVLVDEEARFRAPFTALGVAPEAASSYLFPLLMGWQEAAYTLFTSEWVTAERAVETGLAWRSCPSGTVLDEAMAVAGRIAEMPIDSLVATKRVMTAARRDAVAAARAREDAEFSVLVGAKANAAALEGFLEG